MTSSVKSAKYNVVPHTLSRVDVATGVEFDEFRAAFEKAAPPFDPATVREIVGRGGTWDEVLSAAAKNAPNDLMSTRPSTRFRCLCWLVTQPRQWNTCSATTRSPRPCSP